MKSIFLFVASILLCVVLLQAQEAKPPVNIQSPNAAGLGKYGDVPVSYFTGTPNISIPLHTLNYKGIDLDISLNYDASGINIDQHTGCTGQNWNITAGGVITRSIKGSADELTLKNTKIPGTNNPNIGFLYNFEMLNDVNTTNTSQLSNLAISNEHNQIDFEPDVFTFNFMGRSGKFYMDNDGNWKVDSDHNIMVVYDTSLIRPLFEKFPFTQLYQNTYIYPKVIKGFKLIDGDGTSYVFGNDTSAIEYSIDFYRQRGFDDNIPDYWKANSWYLTAVIDKFGNHLYTFTYERGSFIAQFYRTYYMRSWNYDGGGGLFRHPAPGCAESIPMSIWDIEGNLISPVYLKLITINDDFNYQIQFEYINTTELEYNRQLLKPRYDYMQILYYNTARINYPLYYLQENNHYINTSFGNDYMSNLHWRKLNAVTIGGNLNKRILFRYNDNSTQRLNLSGIDIISGDYPYHQTTYQKYSYDFIYNQFNLLPGYLSKKEDHWGYYKGGSGYTVNSDYQGYYSQRQPNESYLTIGMLSRITYPTGGYTDFEFERHDYTQIVTDDRSGFLSETGIAGGVRIKKITDYDGSSTIIRNFKYVTNYPANHSSTLSSGILTCKPKYYWLDWRCAGPQGGEYALTVFSNNSIVPLANSFGSNIGYSEVIEYRNDSSFTQYKYSNFNTLSVYKDEPPLLSFNTTISPYTKYNDKSLMRGKLINKAVYNSANSIIQDNIYSYRTDASMYNNYILATNAASSQFCPGVSTEGYITGTSYKIYYFDYDQIQEETKDYLTGGTISKINTYTKEDKLFNNPTGFSNLRQLKSSTSFLSDRNIITNYFYPNDLTAETNMESLINDFRIDEPIKTVLTSTAGSVTLPVGVKKTTYKISSTKVVKDKEFYSKTDEANLATLILNNEYNMSYDLYSTTGMLQQYTGSNGIPVALLWDANQYYLMSNIENATFSQVSTQEGKNASTNSKTLWTSLNTLVPNAMIKTYTYSPLLGMTYQTDPSGVTTNYTYDLFGRLEYVKNDDLNLLKKYSYHFYNQ